MPDIAMCQENECPKRELCYRYRAVPELYQWYMKPESYDKNGCSAYLITLPGQKLRAFINRPPII